ncbi:MAG TPA: hypothetical protein VGQ42_02170 [Candidatus Dormibacteraeota bacterium]|nr:hypothetical protein [Candidatus Dormibacteraeota bacterium]
MARRETAPTGGGDERTQAPGGLPADVCGYPRPFPEDFADCPAFRGEIYRPTTTGYAALEPVITCTNLEAGPVPRHAARFYGRCRVGDAEARRRWAADHPPQ